MRLNFNDKDLTFTILVFCYCTSYSEEKYEVTEDILNISIIFKLFGWPDVNTS